MPSCRAERGPIPGPDASNISAATRTGAEFFDLEGIRKALVATGDGTPEELAQALLDAAREWAGNGLQDDAAIVVVERPHLELTA